MSPHLDNPLGQLPFPTQLAFEPVQLCNAACFCCPYTWLRNDDDYRGVRMPRERIKELLDQFGGVREKHKYDGILWLNPFRYSDPLVCKDLDLIFELAERYDIAVRITTNGVSLKGTNLDLLEKYQHRIQKISISVIGSDEESVKKYMDVSLDKTLKNISEISANRPMLRGLLRVSLRAVEGTDEERQNLDTLKNQLTVMKVDKTDVPENWLTNRVDVETFGTTIENPDRLENVTQNDGIFVNGCGWGDHLLERMEVMVDGDVVLCCDDAERHKVFGNVFRDGIESIWSGPLRQEHIAIMAREYRPEKQNLICMTCSRAQWHAPARHQVSQYVYRSTTEQDGGHKGEAYYLRQELNRVRQRMFKSSDRLRETSDRLGQTKKWVRLLIEQQNSVAMRIARRIDVAKAKLFRSWL